MGFALWVDDELAWSEGRHEYQPMGRAVIARTDLFRERDFRRPRRIEPESLPGYAGLFASLGEVNAFLAKQRAQAKPADSEGSSPVGHSRGSRSRAAATPSTIASGSPSQVRGQ